MNIKFLDHYALGVIFTPSVCICHLTLVNNKMYFVLKFMDPSRRAITVEEKYCVKLLAVTGLFFSLPSCHHTVIKWKPGSGPKILAWFLWRARRDDGEHYISESDAGVLAHAPKRRQCQKRRLQGSSLPESQACQQDLAAPLKQKYNPDWQEWLWLFNRVAWAAGQLGHTS